MQGKTAKLLKGERSDHNDMHILSLDARKESNKWNTIIVIFIGAAIGRYRTNLECILNREPIEYFALIIFRISFMRTTTHDNRQHLSRVPPIIKIEKLYIPQRWQFLHRYFYINFGEKKSRDF